MTMQTLEFAIGVAAIFLFIVGLDITRQLRAIRENLYRMQRQITGLAKVLDGFTSVLEMHDVTEDLRRIRTSGQVDADTLRNVEQTLHSVKASLDSLKSYFAGDDTAPDH